MVSGRGQEGSCHSWHGGARSCNARGKPNENTPSFNTCLQFSVHRSNRAPPPKVKMPVASGSSEVGEMGHTGKAKKKHTRHSKAGSSTTSHFDHNAQLLEAISQGKPRVVRRLLDSRADPNYQGGPKMMSPLMQACEIKEEAARESIIELLLSKGADVNLQDISGQTALMKAILNGIPEASRLIKLGADVQLEDVDGNIALNYAAEMGDAEWTHMLTREGKKKGVHIDHQNLHGLTPLLLAAREGHLVVAKVLVEGGASLSKRDLEHFMTALEWMKLTGCYSAHELEFLNPTSRKRNYYRRERMKKGIKTLADFLPSIEGGADSPNVFTMPQPQEAAFLFPKLSNKAVSSVTEEQQPLKSMFDFSLSKGHQQQSTASTHGNTQRRNSISFPAVSSVKTDLYTSSYLSRRKSMLLKNSFSDGYHMGALAPISSSDPTPIYQQDSTAPAKTSRLPPINK